jgi:large subunit ribosomal protein L4
MKISVTTLDGKSAGDIDLDDAIFGLEPRQDILHRMVRWQLAKRQAGTHKTKGRSEITGSTKKFVRQKGSGGARHGNRKVPQFRGGGRAFGPVVRSHAHDLPKKFRSLALKHALSVRAKDAGIIVVDDFSTSEPKTKALREKLAKLGIANALFVGGAELDGNFVLASRNIAKVDVLPIQGINVYDILRRDALVLSKGAVDALQERFK